MYLNAMRSQSILEFAKMDKRASMQLAIPEKVITAIGTSALTSAERGVLGFLVYPEYMS